MDVLSFDVWVCAIDMYKIRCDNNVLHLKERIVTENAENGKVADDVIRPVVR